jgi:hypothetical protein
MDFVKFKKISAANEFEVLTVLKGWEVKSAMQGKTTPAVGPENRVA